MVTKNKWELTDEEVAKAYGEEAEKYPHSLGAPLYYGKRAVAKAQAKKLAECFERRLSCDEKEIFLTWCLPIKKWQRLCKKLGIKNG